MAEKIGEYDILEKLGTGGFGSVWKARSPGGEIVAIKLLDPKLLDNDLVVRKFFSEAMILARLDHKNITKLKDFFPDESNYVIVMDFVEGITLREFLDREKGKEGRIPLVQTLGMARQILEAFQYAHDAEVIHRDIKPGNIMISKNGLIKIMDFGIAKISSTPTHSTSRHMFSYYYAAPERFKGRPVDARSDIYSLGIVFYELFTGEKPFNSKDTAELMYRQLNDPPPTKYLNNIPGPSGKAILKALEKEPEKRFQNCLEFSKALARDIPTLPDEDAIPPDDDGKTIVEIPSKIGKSKVKIPRHFQILALAILVIGIAVGLYFGWDHVEPHIPGLKPHPTRPGQLEPNGKNEKGFEEFKHQKDGSVMIMIPKGEFKMGSEENDDEKPVQSIYLDGYFIDKFLVANSQFKKFVEEQGYETNAEKEGEGMVWTDLGWNLRSGANWRNPDGFSSAEGKDDHPVTQVSYDDAANYCRWAGKKLPTEAQWEKAARGPEGNEYPWGNTEPDPTRANYRYGEELSGTTTPVGHYTKGQSDYGAFDMAGNVYQWCRDWYDTGKRKGKNPTGPETGKERVVKGGSFNDSLGSLRSANRGWFEPDYSNFIFGFRCVLEP
ncbi:bifunctional serine/threonine-protein kinase/formylglycine-generating enzyme family protein [bacterium]|nr:bifunctional serine/threonine-protein kinase/formylglycine-generating enzyme family protein [bacterium]